jgi:hypothetical protein
MEDCCVVAVVAEIERTQRLRARREVTMVPTPQQKENPQASASAESPAEDDDAGEEGIKGKCSPSPDGSFRCCAFKALTKD